MKNPNSPQKIAVLCAGEALIDLMADAQGQLTPCLGGAVYNLARALALQGVKTGYLNPLSGDFYGAALREGLIQSGVHLLEPAVVNSPTSLAIARLDAQGKANYAFYREGVADRHIAASQLNRLSANALSDNSEKTIVCTGCLALSPDDASAYLPWLAEQKRLGRLIAIDINIRAAIMKDHAAYKSNIYAALQYADIIKASDDDLVFLNTSAAELFNQTNASIFLLTLGAQGAQALTREGETLGTLTILEAPTPSCVQVVDTVGAGDCFFAGFLAHWLRPESNLQAALKHAVLSASISVSRQGCQPPTWDEVASEPASAGYVNS